MVNQTELNKKRMFFREQRNVLIKSILKDFSLCEVHRDVLDNGDDTWYYFAPNNESLTFYRHQFWDKAIEDIKERIKKIRAKVIRTGGFGFYTCIRSNRTSGPFFRPPKKFNNTDGDIPGLGWLAYDRPDMRFTKFGLGTDFNFFPSMSYATQRLLYMDRFKIKLQYVNNISIGGHIDLKSIKSKEYQEFIAKKDLTPFLPENLTYPKTPSDLESKTWRQSQKEAKETFHLPDSYPSFALY